VVLLQYGIAKSTLHGSLGQEMAVVFKKYGACEIFF